MESKFLFLNNNQLNVLFLLWLNKPRVEKLRWLYSGYQAILLKSREVNIYIYIYIYIYIQLYILIKPGDGTQAHLYKYKAMYKVQICYSQSRESVVNYVNLLYYVNVVYYDVKRSLLRSLSILRHLLLLTFLALCLPIDSFVRCQDAPHRAVAG